MKEKISVILPAYNERANIAALIPELQRELEGLDFEIIVVDDSSSDGTFEAAQKAGENVVAVAHSGERGFASSIRCGIERSSGQKLVIMDSDFNHEPRYVRGMVETLSSCDCVVMSRFIPGGGMKSLARRVSGLIYNKFIRLVTGGEISDYLFGFIAVRRSVIDPSGFDAVFYGFGDYCVRLLLGIERNNASIKELPARHGTRRHGKSGNRLWKTFIRYTIETLKLAGRNYGYRNK